MNLNYHPQNGNSPYYIEFREGEFITWTLFRRNFQEFAKNDYNKSGEVHPYNLGWGRVNTNPNIIDMNSMVFLYFMVDALNEKAEKDAWEKINIY